MMHSCPLCGSEMEQVSYSQPDRYITVDLGAVDTIVGHSIPENIEDPVIVVLVPHKCKKCSYILSFRK